MSADFSLAVAAPASQVFAYLADPRHRPEWQPSLRGIDLVDGGTPRAGTRWIDRTVVGFRPRMQIVAMMAPGEADVPGRWGEVGQWRTIRASLDLTFVAVADHPARTRVRVTVRFASSRRWLPVRLVLQAVAPTVIRSDLQRAGRIVERRCRSAR